VGYQQPKPGRCRPDVGDIEADDFGAPQRAGEADQKDGAVPQACQIIAANLFLAAA